MTKIGGKTRYIVRKRRKNKYKDNPSFRQKNGGKIIPAVERCVKCKIKKVKYHHWLCNKCWKEEHG